MDGLLHHGLCPPAQFGSDIERLVFETRQEAALDAIEAAARDARDRSIDELLARGAAGLTAKGVPALPIVEFVATESRRRRHRGETRPLLHSRGWAFRTNSREDSSPTVDVLDTAACVWRGLPEGCTVHKWHPPDGLKGCEDGFVVGRPTPLRAHGLVDSYVTALVRYLTLKGVDLAGL